jgi:hypothetical protein
MSTEENAKRVMAAFERQNEVLKGMIITSDMLFSMLNILNDRVMALEERAEGVSMQDILDGKELKPLGIQPEHVAKLEEMNGILRRLAQEGTTKLKEE